ncbi:Molybdenum cofactor synthesis protein 1 [Trebouxia sp. C0009 RCD-2024]
MWAKSTVGRLAARHFRLSNASSHRPNERLLPLGDCYAATVPGGTLHNITLRHNSKEASFGFSPEDLDLVHLDQTQTSLSSRPGHELGLSHAGTDTLSSQPLPRPQAPVPQHLTHLDSHGRAQMVDVGQKDATVRTATASAIVQLNHTAFEAIAADGMMAKGHVLTVAQLAGIMGAKQTSQLIPLCHNIPLDKVSVELRLDSAQQCVHIEAMAKTQAYTGVEMEAMVAASVAALTVYDMCKALDKGITIKHVALETKTGGKSGDYHRRREE